MAKAYVDGLFPDGEYQRQKKLLEMELESTGGPPAGNDRHANQIQNAVRMVLRSVNLSELTRQPCHHTIQSCVTRPTLWFNPFCGDRESREDLLW
jgi:hypothetical protein